MNCKKCGEAMMVESSNDKTTTYVCKKCGMNEVRNREGKQYLADGGTPAPGRRPLFG